MSDEPSTALATTQQPRAVRVYERVEDAIPILDSARFEHMQRIASSMAAGSLIPQTLRGTGTGDKFEPFDHAVVTANCFRVVNQAVRWGMDPFAVIDCCSVVHGRLMYEGKLVHAVVEERVGIRLRSIFGRMVDGKFDPSQEGAGEALAIQVIGRFPDEDEDRTVEGYVGQWKTTGSNSPWSPANFKRQLRYRGTREWARAHSPGVILGVLTDDDLIEDRRTDERRAPERVDLISKLSGGGDEGFSQEHVETHLGGAGDDAVSVVVVDAETGEVHEAEPAEVAEIIAAVEAEQSPEAEAIALHSGGGGTGAVEDAPGVMGGDVSDDDLMEVLAVDTDAPTDDTSAADPGPDPSSLIAQATATDESDPVQMFWRKVGERETWAGYKAELGALAKSEWWTANADLQNTIRASLWDRVKRELIDTGKDRVDQASDPTAFRCWIETQDGPEGGHAIRGTLRILQRDDRFKKLPKAAQDQLAKVAEDRAAAQTGEA